MTFDATTEAWRPLVTQYAGDLPIEFLMAWIKRESEGSPCSWTAYSEAGIFQLLPPDNVAQGGTTLAAIHPVPPCSSGIQTNKWFSDLTPDQAYEQVRSGVQYVNAARTRSHQLLTANGGQDWDEGTVDFWILVKFYHNLPGTIAPGLAAAAADLGRPAASWSELRPYINAPAKWLDYAEWIGSYVAGGPDAWLQMKNIVIDIADPVTSPPTPPGDLSPLGIFMGLAGIAAGAAAGYYASKRYLHGR